MHSYKCVAGLLACLSGLTLAGLVWAGDEPGSVLSASAWPNGRFRCLVSPGWEDAAMTILERFGPGARHWTPLNTARFEDGHDAVLEDPFPLRAGRIYRCRVIRAGEFTDADGDDVADLEDPSPLNPAAPVQWGNGALELGDLGEYLRLAHGDPARPETNYREVKFIVSGLDAPRAGIWYMNTQDYPSHIAFAGSVLGIDDFARFAYAGARPRKYFAGSLVYRPDYRDSSGEPGILVLETLPNDPVPADLMGRVFQIVRLTAPGIFVPIAYHPSGPLQMELYEKEKALYEASEIRVAGDGELYAQVGYAALNTGVAYGWLRVHQGGSVSGFGTRDVVVFRSIPNETGRLAGVITESPQTPLSHINLKAKQNGTPNAYLRRASDDPELRGLLGELVRIEVAPAGLRVEAADLEAAEVWWEQLRPAHPMQLPFDVSTTEILGLDEAAYGDRLRVGAKAANLGELFRMFPGRTVAGGFAIPFSWYDLFLAANSLEDDVERALVRVREGSVEDGEQALKDLRRRIERSPAPAWMAEELELARTMFAEGQGLRCRSSTNNEDLQDFNGAGLYESNTHRPGEGRLIGSVQKVWASLWTQRAVEEREFYRIDHATAKMGVLVHPNFDDEQGNGVAVASNLYVSGAPGYTINVQLGEDLVTNPSPDAVPEEWLMVPAPDGETWSAVKMRSSSLAEEGTELLDEDQRVELAEMLEEITARFREWTGTPSARFAMEIEFKVTEGGALIIKQARPWVE